MISNPHALIVATESYDDSDLAALRSPAQDAQKLSEVLANPAIGNYSLTTLLNKPGEVIKEEVEGFFAERKPVDLALLYISGHGIKDPNGDLYFAARTTKLKRLASTGISAQFIYQQVNRCRARRIVLLLDCCFSGAYLKGHIPRAPSNVQLPSPLGKGWAVITSSTALEYSFEADTWRSTGKAMPSLFTAALVQGLRTGEADRDGDGFVSVDELYDYVVEEVRKATTSQTPEMKYGDIRGRIMVAKNPYVFSPDSGTIAVSQNAPDSDYAHQQEVPPTAEELERSYSDALSAYYAGRWQKAVDGFQEVVKSDPSFKDAPGKLSHASRQLHLSELYSASVLATEEGNWAMTVRALNEIRRAEPGYRDIIQRLNIARLGSESDDLVTKAESLFQSRSLAEVETICAELASIVTRMHDMADDLVASAPAKIEDQEVALRYRLALAYLESHDWRSALSELNRVNRIRHGYRDSSHLLDHARTELMRVSVSRESQTLIKASATDWIKKIVFSHNGQLIAVGSDTETRIWEVASGREILLLKHRQQRDEARTVRYSPYSDWVVLALSPGGQLLARLNHRAIEIIATSTGRIMHRINREGRLSPPSQLIFFRNSKFLAGVAGDNIIVWDVRTGSEVKKLAGDVHHGNPGIGMPYESFALSVDDRLFAYTSYQGICVKTVSNSKDEISNKRMSGNKNVPYRQTLQMFRVKKDVVATALSAEGTYLAAVLSNGAVRTWNVAQRILLPRPKFFHILTRMKSAEFSSDSKLLATTSRNRKAYIWDISSGNAVLAIPHCYEFCFSPDMRLIATSYRNEVHIQRWPPS